MVALVIGSNNLLDTIRKHVPEQSWHPPFGGDEIEQMRMLAQVPAPRSQQKIVLTNVGGNWSSVAQLGWQVLWCEPTSPPVGCVSVLQSFADDTVRDLCARLWRAEAPDMRQVGDLVHGRTHTTATMLQVTGFTGGVGKTTSAWRLALAAAEHGVRTLLVDANRDQSSVRSFFDPGERLQVRTVADWVQGAPAVAGANQGSRLFQVPFDIAFAPSAGQEASWEHYRQFLHEASLVWDFIVVDYDRVSVESMQDDASAGGALLAPLLRAGTATLFVVKAGLQTQGDAARQLRSFDFLGLPNQFCGFKEVIPLGMDERAYRTLNYKPFGVFLGAERMSDMVADEIAQGKTGFSDPQLDDVRDRVLDWVLPDRGFAHEPTVVKRRWFGRKNR